jgi:hypothetical protein
MTTVCQQGLGLFRILLVLRRRRPRLVFWLAGITPSRETAEEGNDDDDEEDWRGGKAGRLTYLRLIYLPALAASRTR